MKGLIYKVTNLINNKIYIGQTINSLSRRRSSHYTAARAYKGCPYFHQALIKYKEKDFKWEILESFIEEDEKKLKEILNKKEIYYIKIYNSNKEEFGYNLTSGGESYQEQALNFWNSEKGKNYKKNLSLRMTAYWDNQENVKQHKDWMNNFYKTAQGIEQAKRHSDFMKNYYNGPDARKNKAKTAKYFVKAISPKGEEIIFISSKEPNLYLNKNVSLRTKIKQIGDIWIPTKRSSLYGWKFEAIEKFEII